MFIIRKNNLGDDDVSQDTVNQFELSILSNSDKKIKILKNDLTYTSIFLKWILLKINLPYHKLIGKKYSTTFCIHMGPEYGKSAYHFLLSKTKIAYFFDLWPYTLDSAKKYLIRANIDYAFISSFQTVKYLSEAGYKNIFWIPEGIDPSQYNFLPYAQKDIDVLELGRKHNEVHQKIKQSLTRNNKKHLYETTPGKIIFSDHKSMVEGLARTKISICFPRSTTHPQSAGNISTMTARYLQSMASKCLIVGESPSEFKYLFEYEPIISLDIANAEQQIIEIINNYENYIPLIERNYLSVINAHKWSDRWDSIKKIINF